MKSVNQCDLELVAAGWMKYVHVYMPARPWVVVAYSSFQWTLKLDPWNTSISHSK